MKKNSSGTDNCSPGTIAKGNLGLSAADVNDLLNGAIEMHVHGAPDIVPRKASDIELLRDAKAAGIIGVMLKCHATPTTVRAVLAQEAVGGVLAFGGIVLNQPMGGLNPLAVETELTLGAKAVWLPTQSAVNDIEFHKRISLGTVPLFDEEGKFLPELHEIMELVAQKDVILGTGHISYQESEKVVALAKTKGVKKIVITHPEAPRINMPLQTMKELARQGVMFEWVAFNMTTLTAGRGKVPPEVYVRNIKAVGAEACVMATDFGQVNNDSPAVGLAGFIRAMLDNGISPKDIRMMVRDNPLSLLGLR
ncbi:MAG: DUF6282 family protein [Negativicutes bacterium]|nr:DUF6282 family protein [Negativicutes bacterium]